MGTKPCHELVYLIVIGHTTSASRNLCRTLECLLLVKETKCGGDFENMAGMSSKKKSEIVLVEGKMIEAADPGFPRGGGVGGGGANIQFCEIFPKTACWIVLVSGGFKGSARGAPPPGCPNSFDFMQFSGKSGKIVCWRPPWEVGAPWGNPGSAAAC